MNAPEAKSAPVKKIYVAFDIEKTGSLFSHPINSIGVCVGDDQAVLQKFRINIDVKWPDRLLVTGGTENALLVRDYGDFEPRCWEEFWSKQPDSLIALLRFQAQPAEDAAKRFRTWLDGLEEQYPAKTHKLVFLSDNASFDIASLDHFLEQFTGRIPLRYSTAGKYRSLKAPDDMLAMLPDDFVKWAIKEQIDPLVHHDHDPANDAEHIYRQYLLALKYRPLAPQVFATIV